MNTLVVSCRVGSIAVIYSRFLAGVRSCPLAVRGASLMPFYIPVIAAESPDHILHLIGINDSIHGVASKFCGYRYRLPGEISKRLHQMSHIAKCQQLHGSESKMKAEEFCYCVLVAATSYSVIVIV